ncbi:SDR family oxidoreductase [Thermoactinomyces sp. CICC 10521]|uniref:SDR family NAD(P)-dependent oxidoreductase n=1 Tax=Thermoactinomyces sp. CICC 10521 TaxID=2767426 RepID=UPI0018DD5AA4|nr:SDR family oxidoreductase [Thermoactinomyces sp. CICC 10521]MBH8606501.1 SDR family oxidoreductase [Thermoactinomyces sp. CICC 10521]
MGIALITGASEGIGKELAYLFAKDGHDLVLVARNVDQLNRVATEIEERYQRTIHIITQDLSQPDAPRQIRNTCVSLGLQIDYLVNNAGFGLYGPFAEQPLEDLMQMINLNIKALTALTHYFLPDLLASKSSGILNVGSMASFVPGPLMAVYYASKAYTLSFTEALAHELKESGVKVTALCPGPVKTRFAMRAKMHQSRLTEKNALDAFTVAKAGYEGLLSGKPVVVPGAVFRSLLFGTRFLPRNWIASSVMRIQQDRTPLR